jgi:biopolymer transport protein ExbB
MSFGTNAALLAQAGQEHGWLTQKLLGVTLTSADWILWLLAGLSVISIAVILERLWFFWSHRLPNFEQILVQLGQGNFEAAAKSVSDRKGLEAEVVRAGLQAATAARGADAVEQVIASTIARERPKYERSLSFLGTLGNNAPFIGLFGTVLGIIKAFHDLGRVNVKGAMVQQTVMTGISEALVATAVGLAVAIPAVVAYNAFTRWLKNMTARTNALGHAIVGHLHGESEPEVLQRKPGRPAAVVQEVR